MKLAKYLSAASVACLASAAVAQDAELLAYTNPGHLNPMFHQAYIAAHGQSPTFTFFGDEEESFQKVRAGFKVDVLHTCAGTVPKFTEGAADLIEPWDRSKIENLDQIDTSLIGADLRTPEGDLLFVPTDFGTTAIAYNTDQVAAEDVASLDIFLNPKYAGRVTIPDNVDDAWALAYLATGVTAWEGIRKGSPEFEAAATWLRQVHPNLRTYWIDPAELAQLHATGEILVSWAWNETFPTLVADGYPVGFQRDTKEGTSLWLCGYMNMKNGPGVEDKAYDYLNALLADESAPFLVEAGFAGTNQRGMSALGEEALTAGGIGSVAEGTTLFMQLPMSVDQREEHVQEFEMIKAGF